MGGRAMQPELEERYTHKNPNSESLLFLNGFIPNQE